MNFLRKNLFLKLIKEFQKRKTHSSDTWHHQSLPRGMLTSAGGQYQLTSAVGPADIIIDRSTVNEVSGSEDPLVSLTLRLTGGIHRSGWEKEKGKRGSAPILG
jgi:hypothetical protein